MYYVLGRRPGRARPLNAGDLACTPSLSTLLGPCLSAATLAYAFDTQRPRTPGAYEGPHAMHPVHQIPRLRMGGRQRHVNTDPLAARGFRDLSNTPARSRGVDMAAEHGRGGHGGGVASGSA
jgi:hypothetical protein